jgi:hypothetical protein
MPSFYSSKILRHDTLTFFGKKTCFVKKVVAKKVGTLRGVAPVVTPEGDLVCIEGMVEGETESPCFYS